MKILITAGNTMAMIDRVRAITNIFSGRTGAGIAVTAHQRGHAVTLLTSRPDTVREMAPSSHWRCVPFRTFEDLEASLQAEISTLSYDAVIHCAAVSDYRCVGTFAPASPEAFDPQALRWAADTVMVDRLAGKVKSDEPELWLRLVRAPKLIDQMRSPWGFTGVLVKFKLEVGVSEERLLQIAEKSRQQSNADWMVANTLDGAAEWAYLGSHAGYERITRSELATKLLLAIESTCGATHG